MPNLISRTLHLRHSRHSRAPKKKQAGTAKEAYPHEDFHLPEFVSFAYASDVPAIEYPDASVIGVGDGCPGFHVQGFWMFLLLDNGPLDPKVFFL